jgi:FAD/FMN-containing dehydrogenase
MPEVRSPSPLALHLADTPRGRGVVLNDVHSRLNPTRVARVVRVTGLEELRSAVIEAARRSERISVAGGRHAMGGQQLGVGTVHLDTAPLARILDFDRELGVVEVEAGIRWPGLIEGCRELQGDRVSWGIRQKQTGADRLSLGGALAANIHGRGLSLPPFVADVESCTVVDAGGEVVTCSRRRNRHLFSLVAGGYGLFGVVYSLRLRLAPRRKVRRVVELRRAEGLMEAFDQRIAEGFLFGDFQFEVDPASAGFLTRGVFSCYRPVSDHAPIPEGQRELSEVDWLRLLELAHRDKGRAFEEYAAHYRSTDGQLYWSDTHQLTPYLDRYHQRLDRRLGAAVPGSEMITELYVPRPRLAAFLVHAAGALREERAEVIYGTVRLIERDGDSFLAWAREPWACVVLNLHVDHTAPGLHRVRSAFRRLIDLALEEGGSYYLTYHRWATREQLVAAYPQFPDFLACKRLYDPEERFQSDWYRSCRRLVAG